MLECHPVPLGGINHVLLHSFCETCQAIKSRVILDIHAVLSSYNMTFLGICAAETGARLTTVQIASKDV